MTVRTFHLGRVWLPCLFVLSLQRHAVLTVTPTPQVLCSSLPMPVGCVKASKAQPSYLGIYLTFRRSKENFASCCQDTELEFVLPGLGVIISKLIQIGDPSQSGVKGMCLQSSKMYLKGKGVIFSVYTTEKASA